VDDPVATEAGGAETSVAVLHDDVARAREEIMMLVVGFATGLSIAVVFLTYIVLEKAHLLP
jgi:hypothetical protein